MAKVRHISLLNGGYGFLRYQKYKYFIALDAYRKEQIHVKPGLFYNIPETKRIARKIGF